MGRREVPCFRRQCRTLVIRRGGLDSGRGESLPPEVQRLAQSVGGDTVDVRGYRESATYTFQDAQLRGRQGMTPPCHEKKEAQARKWGGVGVRARGSGAILCGGHLNV